MKKYRIIYSEGYYIPQYRSYNNSDVFLSYDRIIFGVKKYRTLERAERFIARLKKRCQKRLDKWYIFGKTVREL
jgi:hypothetical protein